MISLNALLAWNLIANTLAGHEEIDPSILSRALRNAVSLGSLDELRGGVRFLGSMMRPRPRRPVGASVPSTGAPCASSHSDASDDSCNAIEAASSKESSGSGGVGCLHSEIPSTSRPPINASGPCAEASCSNPSEVGNLGYIGDDTLEKYRHAICQFILQERACVPKVTLDQVRESILEGKYPALFSFLKHSGPIRRRDQDDLLPSNFDVEQERLTRLKFSTCDYGKKISRKDPSRFVQHNEHVTDSDGTDHLQMDDVGVGGNTIQLSERNDNTLEPPDKKITNLDGGKRQLCGQTAAALFPIDCTQILQRDVSIPQSNSTIRPNLPLNEHDRSLIPTRTEKASNIIVIPDSSSDDDSDDDAKDAGCTRDDDEMLAAEKHCPLSSQANNNQDSIAEDWTERCWCMECDEGDQLLTCNLCLQVFRESCLGSVRFNEEGLVYCCFCAHGRADLGCLKARKSVLRAKENLSTGRCKDICKRRTGQARVVENVNYWLDDLSLQHRTGGLNRSSLGAEHHEHMEVTDFPGQVEVSVGRCDDSNNVEEVNDVQIVDMATTTVEGADTVSMDEQAKDLQPTENHTPVGNGNFPCEEGTASHSASVNEQVEDLQPTESHMAVDNSNLLCEQGKLSHAASVNEQGEDFQPTEHRTAVDNSILPCEEGNSSGRELDAGVVKQKDEISVGGDHQNIQETDSGEQVKEASAQDTDNEALPSRNSGRHCKRAQDASTKIHEQNRSKSSTGKRRKLAYQAKRYSNPLMPPGRRTKLLWTMEEEAALKEGMQRFVSKDGGTIPWRAILEYGCGVFHKTRLPGDLKDKWRNIKLKEGLQQSCM